MISNARYNFNFKILEKTVNVVVFQVMIINEEQHSFYRNSTFFIPALWSAIESYKELKGKAFFKTVSQKKAFENAEWLVLNYRKILKKAELLSTKNFPLIHNYKDFSDHEWNEIWDNKIDLPTATYKLEFADEAIIEGFEVGMDWDYGVADPFAPGSQLPFPTT